MTKEQQKWVSDNSLSQRKSQYLGMYRRLRLTGSNFCRVIKAAERHEATGHAYPPSLFKTLRGEYNLERRDPILWGKMHEEEALQLYKKKTGNIVMPSGLQLFPCGYLGCSPDGIIIDSSANDTCGALGIKCPWKYRDSAIQEMIEKEKTVDKNLKRFYLTETLNVNPHHDYWHQIEAEIAGLGAKWAHFVIWTKKELFISYVSKDVHWEENYLPKLSQFYLNDFLPLLYTKED